METRPLTPLSQAPITPIPQAPVPMPRPSSSTFTPHPQTPTFMTPPPPTPHMKSSPLKSATQMPLSMQMPLKPLVPGAWNAYPNPMPSFPNMGFSMEFPPPPPPQPPVLDVLPDPIPPDPVEVSLV